MIGKRGDIELQFNWVFVIIVGTLILGIAAGFVFRQKQNSDIILSSQLISFTRSVITISSATPGKAEPQELQKDIGLTCYPSNCTGSGCSSDIYVMPRTLNARMDTKIEAIFSPATLKGSKLGTWSMEWDMPYHVYNFLYLSTDEVRYVFVKPDSYPEGVQLVQKLYNDMPTIMGRKELVSESAIPSLSKGSNYKVRFVFVTDGNIPFPNQFKSMQTRDLTAIRLTPSDDYPYAGIVQFYQKSSSGNSWAKQGLETNYFGLPLAFGAVFSDSRDFYACNLEKSLLRLSLVSKLYRSRLDALIADPAIASCRSIYQGAIPFIEQLENARGLQPAELSSNAQQISQTNTALKFKSCPWIY